MSQKLPVNSFEWIKDSSQFNEEFTKTYNQESDEGYFLKVEIQYMETLHELHSDLPLLPERMKIEKLEKLVANLYDTTEYLIHIRNFKETLNNGLVFKKIYRVIKFNQNALLKPYIDKNTDLRKKSKNDFEKDFFKLKNNEVFGKTMKSVRKNRDIKLVTTERRRNYLVVDPKCHTTKFFTEYLLAIGIKKNRNAY